MAKTVQKIALSASRDIPFDRLVLSQANVRRIKAGVSVEELAEDIARRTLLQSLTVRPVLDEAGADTGQFEIPAGGRRYRALELLVRQKRLARNAPIPCVVRTDGIAEEDSLAENIQRAPLHPLDQFRAFLTLREKGQSEEEIAAVFFVSVQVVKQRLRLASVSPTLLEVYAEDGMTLDQLMGFTVNPDHERQEQVWEAIQRIYNKEPSQIRRLLTEGAVRASDKRALYVAADYQAAGGPVMRDLFQSDDGGWYQDVALLERLVAEKLENDAASIRAEGWKWVEISPGFQYGHSYGLRVLSGTQPPLSEEQEAQIASLQAELEQIEAEYADADEYPDGVWQRMEEIEATLTEINERPPVFEPVDIDRAGAFVSIDGDGKLKVERGYVRHEDEPPLPEPAEPDAVAGVEGDDGSGNRAYADEAAPGDESGDGQQLDAPAREVDDDPDEGEGLKPLPDRLLTELTAYRTLALREAVANDSGIALLAVLHVLTLKLFYQYSLDSCLEVGAKIVLFGSQAPGLADSKLAATIDERHRGWAEQLPQNPSELWEVLSGFDSDSRDALFAHCASLTVNAVYEAFNRRPKALAHADRLAEVTSLDMVAAGWAPSVDNYLGRVTKARIIEAVHEAKGDDAVQHIAHLKKGDMANAAERLLNGTGWLPEPLRTRGLDTLVRLVPEPDAVIDDLTVHADVTLYADPEATVAEAESSHPHEIAAE